MSTVGQPLSSSIGLALPTSTPTADVPKLHNGDRLTRAEFERRYCAMPEVRGAQLIEGIVYMPSPVRLAHHGEPHGRMLTWIGYYVAKTPGLRFAGEATSRLDEDNEPQPDVMLLLPASAGGSAVIDEDDYVSGPPEFVAEVSASTVSIDLHAKKNAYRRNGVKEYLVWRVEEGAIDWFELVAGRYDLLTPDDKGVVRSNVFPGLWLDAPAMLRGDLPAVFATIDAGTATPEHEAFKQRVFSGA
jgi:Uma2 family endonuclease